MKSKETIFYFLIQKYDKTYLFLKLFEFSKMAFSKKTNFLFLISSYIIWLNYTPEKARPFEIWKCSFTI